MPPIEGLDAIDGAWTNREATTDEGDPGAAADRRRRRGRRRDGAGVPDARQPGHADRGRAAAAPARGGVRLRAGDRGARALRRRHPHRAEGGARRAGRRRHRDRHDVRRRQRGRRRAARRARPRAVDEGRRASRPSASSRARPSRSTRTCACPATRGCTRSATSTAARCSPTWASTRRGSSADHVLGHDHVLAHGADGPLSPRVIFTEPQVAAVGHTTETAEQAGLIVDVYETSTSGNAGGSFYGRNAPGHDALDRRPRAADRRRLHDHRRRGRGLPARGDDRDRRRGAARAPAPRRPVVSRRAARVWLQLERA